MGSFNTTCAISHAPIREGDEVRLFFLKSGYVSEKHEATTNGFQCYPYDDFTVVGGVSVKAIYADYNNYEFDEETPEARHIMNILKSEYLENIPVEGEDYNPYHDHMSVKVEDLDFETIQNMVHSGRFFVRNYGTNKCFIATMAVHEGVYQVVKKNSYQKYVSDDGGKYVTVTIDDCVKKDVDHFTNQNYDLIFETEYKKLLERHKDKLGTEDTEKVLKMIESLAEVKAEMAIDNYDYDNDGRFRHASNGSNPIKSFINKLRQEKLESLPEGSTARDVEITEDEISGFIRSVVEGEFFNIGMYEYNLMYRPLLTSGQEHDMSGHAAFLNKMADAVTEVRGRWDDENVQTKIHKEHWQEITISELREQFKEWYDDEYEENMQPILDAIAESEMIVINPEDWNWDIDPLGIYDMFNNKAIPLRILNK